jgi:hypothetical protein
MTNDEDQQVTTITSAPAVDALKLLANLATLFANPAKLQKEIQRYEGARSAATRAEARLAAREAAVADLEKATRTELEAERAAIEKRRVAVHGAEGVLDARAQFICKLEAAWANLGEPDDVISGFKSPEKSALQKARRAHGLDDDRQHDEAGHASAASPGGGETFGGGATLTRELDGEPTRAAS